MGSLTVCVALTWMTATVLLCSQAAPVTEFFGPPQTIEGDSNLNYPNYDQPKPKKVEEMERFHRTYDNGTVEFKMALSNGHVQYQRISSKTVNGNKVQVYEGYISEQYKDGRYGTRYYAADENGYRSSPVIIENQPPQLPTSGPYSSSLPRNVQNELSTLSNDDNQNKPKTITDNLVDFENVLEEELLSSLNLGSNISNENSIVTTNDGKVSEEPESSFVPSLGENSFGNTEDRSTEKITTTETESNLDLSTSSLAPEILSNLNPDSNILNETSIASTELDTPIHLDENEILEKKFNEDKSVAELSSTSILGNDDNAREEPESSTITSLGNENSFGNIEDTSSERITSAETESNLDLSTSSLAPIELSSTSISHVNENEILDKKFNEEQSVTEISSTSISENDGKVSESSTLPTLGENSFIIIAEDQITNDTTDTDKLDESSDLPILHSIQLSEEELTGRSLHPSTTSDILSEGIEDVKIPLNEPIEILPKIEVRTQKSIVESPDPTTETLLNDEVASFEQTATLNNEAQDPSTGGQEIHEEKTEDEILKTFEYPLEDAESKSTTTLSPTDVVSHNSDEIIIASSEQPSLEDNATEINSSAETASDFDFSTSSLAPEISKESTGIDEFPTEKSNSDEIKSEEPVVLYEDIIPNSEVRTETSLDEVSEASTGTFVNDEVVLTEQPIQELSGGIPESNGPKISGETSSVSIYPLEGAETESTTLSTGDNISTNSAEVSKDLTEKPSVEIIEDKSTEAIVSETESNANLPTSSLAPEIENESTEINELEPSTDLPLDESNNAIADSESQGNFNREKNGRSFDYSTQLPLQEKNSTNNIVEEGSGSEEGNNLFDTSIISKINEETTNKIEISTEQTELSEEISTATILPNENNSADVTTEAESISKKNNLEATSSEANEVNITEKDLQILTEQPSDLTSSEENSSEEQKQKSIEDETSSTELPEESIEEKHNNKATNYEESIGGEILSTISDETEEKTSGVEVEFSPPVIHF